MSFGMLMPGRNTQSNLQGGFSSGGITTVNGNTYVSNLTVTTRIGNAPNTYKAANSIEFVGEYVDNGSEEYEAFIVNQTNPDPNPTTGTVSSFIDKGYRYGFNGQEKSDEITEGLTTALFWEYDSRIGRRWNIDPELNSDLSSYHSFANNPINNIDPDGLHQYRAGEDGKIKKTKTKDKFDEFFLFRDSDGDGVKSWERVAKFDKNDKGLIALQSSFRSGNWGWNYTGSKNENYISGDAMAAVIGTLSISKLVVSFNHWSNADGTSPTPSKSHKDGTVGDVRPVRVDRSGERVLVSDNQFDKEANTTLIANAKLFGWTSVLSEKYNGWITPGTTHYTKPRHNNHYHLQRFKPFIELTTDLVVATQHVRQMTIIIPKMAIDATYVKPPIQPNLNFRKK